MSGNIHAALQRPLVVEGSQRGEYTTKAYRMLPALAQPRILDIGCGTGGPTLTLAGLSGGLLIGLDVDLVSLRALKKEAQAAALAHRLYPVCGSLFALGFPAASFDLLWSEGAIWRIGFERGLREWRRLLRPGGCLVVHEAVWLRPDPPQPILAYGQGLNPGLRTVPENLAQIPACGFDLLGSFALPEDAWWTEYYGPLEARIAELREEHAADPEALAVLDERQREVDLFSVHRAWYGSAFFVMRRRP